MLTVVICMIIGFLLNLNQERKTGGVVFINERVVAGTLIGINLVMIIGMSVDTVRTPGRDIPIFQFNDEQASFYKAPSTNPELFTKDSEKSYRFMVREEDGGISRLDIDPRKITFIKDDEQPANTLTEYHLEYTNPRLYWFGLPKSFVNAASTTYTFNKQWTFSHECAKHSWDFLAAEEDRDEEDCARDEDEGGTGGDGVIIGNGNARGGADYAEESAKRHVAVHADCEISGGGGGNDNNGAHEQSAGELDADRDRESENHQE